VSAAAATPAKTPQGDGSDPPSAGGGAVPTVASWSSPRDPPSAASIAVELPVMTRSVKLLTPVVTVAVMLGSAVVHARFIGHYPLTDEPRFGWELALTGLILVSSYAVGVTERNITLGSRFLRSTGAVGAAIVIISLIQLAGQQPLLPRFLLAMCLVVVPVQTVFSDLGERSRIQRDEQERVVAVLNNEDRERLMADISGPLELPAVLRAAVDPKAALPTDEDPAPLQTLVSNHRATLVVLAREAQASEEIVAQAAELHRLGIRIRTLSLFYDEWLGKLPISELERIALLFDIHEIHRPLYARLKRFLDLAVAVPGMIVLAIVTPFVVIADLVGNRGPLLYRQPRVGKGGERFTILKFRTMRPGDAQPEWTTADDPRLTRVGKAMRRLHLDELPQVWNVIRRDLSIVGPRPEQPHYVEVLTQRIPFYDTRHLVRPGMTGWAQVKYDYGASELDALEKLQYEFFYLRHQSLGLDLRIIGRTIRSVVGLRGR
jgi:lipopolysaccharide/colanic/teichoic acid biosynthesis glycosyltransferase